MPFRILWVDDNIEELRSHVVYLGEKGYAVEGATNGVDGLAMLRENRYDAVLLDEMMPGMGGLETLEGIRRINEHVPVIMITKSEAEDLVTRAIGKRIDDYLVQKGDRAQAFREFARAKALAGGDPALRTAVERQDPRRGAVLPNLPRDHALNVFLGRLFRRLGPSRRPS